jgi:hypothetical protein
VLPKYPDKFLRVALDVNRHKQLEIQLKNIALSSLQIQVREET